jgi:hypothetical protein
MGNGVSCPALIRFLRCDGLIHFWLHGVHVSLPRVFDGLDIVAIEIGYDFLAQVLKVSRCACVNPMIRIPI